MHAHITVTEAPLEALALHGGLFHNAKNFRTLSHDVQGTVLFRARLPLGGGLPDDETHVFIGDQRMAMYYPISEGHCVWTLGTPEASLLNANCPPKPAKKTTVDCSPEQLAQQHAEDGKVTLEVRTQQISRHTFCHVMSYMSFVKCHATVTDTLLAAQGP